ncbi:MAG: quinol:electron acceptor oxidoreductase subunit ActD, partial [Acidobacteriota bacterium]
AKLILLTGSMVGYAYVIEFFIAWYSGNDFEWFAYVNRALGPYAWAYWTMVTCNVLAPQVFWFQRARASMPVLFVVSILVNIGMWLERFVIVVTSLHRDFLPSAWDYFSPTLWDVATLLGSFGLFFTLFCLFVRYFPMVAMAEVKGVLPQAHTHTPSREEPAEPRRLECAVIGTGAKPSSAIFGILAEFPSPDQLVTACRALRQAGYRYWDAHSPFPVHGLEKAMGLARSKVPWFVLTLGLGGVAVGMLLQWWVSTVAYPLVISGKPFFSWPAFVPIMFECGILGGAVGAVTGFLLLSRLPQLYHALFRSKRFDRVTDDGFFVSVEARDPKFEEDTEDFLKELGANHVELVLA